MVWGILEALIFTPPDRATINRLSAVMLCKTEDKFQNKVHQANKVSTL